MQRQMQSGHFNIVRKRGTLRELTLLLTVLTSSCQTLTEDTPLAAANANQSPSALSGGKKAYVDWLVRQAHRQGNLFHQQLLVVDCIKNEADWQQINQVVSAETASLTAQRGAPFVLLPHEVFTKTSQPLTGEVADFSWGASKELAGQYHGDMTKFLWNANEQIDARTNGCVDDENRIIVHIYFPDLENIEAKGISAYFNSSGIALEKLQQRALVAYFLSEKARVLVARIASDFYNTLGNTVFFSCVDDPVLAPTAPP